MKKTSRDIHPRNIPTNFEKKSKTLVAELEVLTDGQTDRQTDRPTTRHGNRSSGPNKMCLSKMLFSQYHFTFTTIYSKLLSCPA